MPFFIDNYSNILLNEQTYLRVIEESQFDNPGLIKLEKMIKELREKYKYSQLKVNTDDIAIYDIPELLCNIFGFKSCNFTVSQDLGPNAWTFPLSSKIDKWNYRRCIKKSSQGLKFTEEANVNISVVITSGALFARYITDREIVALILHEIGHNFSDSVNKTLGIYSNFKKVLYIPHLINPMNWVALSNKLTGIDTKIDTFAKDNLKPVIIAFDALRYFYSIYTYVIINISDFYALFGAAITGLVGSFNNIIANIIINPIDIVFKPFAKQDEYTADAFAAMYGYGPELANVLTKIEKNDDLRLIKTAMKENKLDAYYFAFMSESVDYIVGLIFDSHPSNGKRLLNILNLLEREYNNPNMNPKFKKETKKEIQELKELIEKEEHDHSFDGNYWRLCWNKYVLRTSNGKGPKDRMIAEILDKIESFEEE